ncbi:hypothetical protein Ancab_011632 [Ancistrocladus abbreviatus]
MLEDIKLSRSLVDIIMHCVTSTSMQILGNGETAEAFTPSRRLRPAFFMKHDIHMWLTLNLLDDVAYLHGCSWPLLVWHWHNIKVFEIGNGILRRPEVFTIKLVINVQIAMDIATCAQRQLRKKEILVLRRLSRLGWMKLNTDGSVVTKERARAGGLLRSDDGGWASSFALSLRPFSVPMA